MERIKEAQLSGLTHAAAGSIFGNELRTVPAQDWELA
jgi:hypothetical protein